jgi:cell wall-associated NlpC family hydrolase
MEINAYICSGFVQWAYYRGVGKVLEETGDADQTRLREVIFNPEIAQEDSEEVLLSTTPADLANSDKLAWKYLIKDGVVWEVGSGDEVERILRS